MPELVPGRVARSGLVTEVSDWKLPQQFSFPLKLNSPKTKKSWRKYHRNSSTPNTMANPSSSIKLHEQPVIRKSIMRRAILQHRFRRV